GLRAIAVDDGEATANEAAATRETADEENAAKSRRSPAPRQARARAEEAAERGPPRPNSKLALVIGMLQRGAALDALVQATGWLPHTARAALTGLRKRGYTVLLDRSDKDSQLRLSDRSRGQRRRGGKRRHGGICRRRQRKNIGSRAHRIGVAR